jgi:2-polyprenyl-3-methyl-5-hydroxy-6-metoxy-1,4-benzoquinol methylase
MVAGCLGSRLGKVAGDTARGPLCPACRSPRSRVAFEVRGHAFRRCRACASLFLGAPAPQGRLSRLYEGERYFSNPEYESGDYFGYRDYLADRAHIEERFDRMLTHLERLVSPGRLLDVGSGPGLLLAAARTHGWDPHGIDLNAWAATWAREELGVEVQVTALEDAGLEPASFDAVTMLDLIEHVSDPAALLAETARVIKPGGALAVVTPDAGSFATRALGRRWPEAYRAEEHVVLFSVGGLSALLARHCFEPVGWHSSGKRTSLAALSNELVPIAPRAARSVRRAVGGRRLGSRTFELDPRAKFCLYARRVPQPVPTPLPVRIAKRPGPPVPTAIREELEHLARAQRLCDWMFAQFAGDVRGSVAEVGAGIGTFSDRILAAGAERLLMIEPERSCFEALERRFATERRARMVTESIPDAPSLEAAEHNLVVCQNVLEHVDDDAGSVKTMAAALRPGGRLAMLVPAGPRLFGRLDLAYGHRRRYTRSRVRALIEGAGLELIELRPFNLLGVPGWWLQNHRRSARVSRFSLAAYEALLPLWRPLEERLGTPWGLSLVVRARRPGS